MLNRLMLILSYVSRRLIKKVSISLMVKVLVVVLLLFIIVVVSVDVAVAATVQDGSVRFNAGAPGRVLCDAVLQLTDTLGRAIAMIGVLILGVGALYGKITWGQATVVGVGIAAIFGASQLVVNIATFVPTGGATPVLNCIVPR